VCGTVAGRAAQLGVTSWHISLSHDGGIASALVIAEGLSIGGRFVTELARAGEEAT
jgi:holo-[acyl-carrier protein] synthase